MIPKTIYLNLSGEKYKIFEPNIYDLFQIELLSEDTDNIKENIKLILEILGIPQKYLVISSSIINQVLSGFREKNKNSGGNDYFLGILGMLAHHNFMDLKSFQKQYCLSHLPELLKVREYYFNIINDKASENIKFHDKNSFSQEEDKKMEEFIKKMTIK